MGPVGRCVVPHGEGLRGVLTREVGPGHLLQLAYEGSPAAALFGCLRPARAVILPYQTVSHLS